jgi:hypothetical protein
MATRIYNKMSGESRIVADSQVRLYVSGGLWSTTPQSGLSTAAREGGVQRPAGGGGSVVRSGAPSLGPADEDEDDSQANQIGRNLTASQVQGLYDDGILSYEAAYAALLASRILPAEAELLLAGRGPQREIPGWMDTVATNLQDILTAGAKDAGFADPASFAGSFLDYYWEDMQSAVFGGGKGPLHPEDPQNIRSFIEMGRKYLQQRWTYGDLPAGGTTGSGRGGGGGGGGGRTTAQMFDIDQLADRINETWRLYTLADAPNAKDLARQYVQTVAGNPAQALDFATWAKRRVLESPDAKFLFRNKPSGVSEEDYMRFYASNVFGVLGPTGDAPTVARNAAAFGASPDSLEGRLRFHPTVAKSSKFIDRIENRYRSLRDVLGGGGA